MGKHLKKQRQRLADRRASFDALDTKEKGARTRPGSMNPHKSQSLKQKATRGRR